jgi:protein subunit release factor A
MLLLSDMKEMAPKFQVMNSSLKWLIGDENYMVASRILALLDFVDQEVQSTGILKKLELHEGNSMIKKVDIDSNVLKEGLFDENQVNQLILQFFHEILRLENNLKRQGESDTEKSLKDLTTLLEADLKECEKELNKIESRLNELKA